MNHAVFEIFPDYSSTGIWITPPGCTHHCGATLEELPFELHPRIAKKISVMLDAYELFCADYVCLEEGVTTLPSITTEESFDFMVFDIYQDIYATHPAQRHLFKVNAAYEHVFAEQEKKRLLQAVENTPVSAPAPKKM